MKTTNKTTKRSTSTSTKVTTLPKGVRMMKNKKSTSYVARLALLVNGKQIYKHVGSYSTPKLAYTARKEYIMSLI